MKYSRRNFLKTSATGIVATLMSPTILIASPSPYPYKTPTSREDLKNIPEDHLLARMIIGEANICSYHEKLAIGYTAINRMNDGKKYNGETHLTNVLLKKYKGDDQYDCFMENSRNKYIMENFRRTLDPAKHNLKQWEESLKIAKIIIQNIAKKLNKGQTSYVTKSKIKEWKAKGKTNNWFFKSIPVDLSPYEFNFAHSFVKEPIS